MTTPNSPTGSITVTTRPEGDSALARLDPQALIRQAIESSAGIDTLERLLALAERVQADAARRAWYAAMAEFQRRCPAVYKTSTASIAMRSGGRYTYSYAPLQDILPIVRPVMGDLGLSCHWITRNDETMAYALCRVIHADGHAEQSGEIGMPIPPPGADGAGANAPQRVGIALTYARRYALVSLLGLAPEDEDTDGAVELPAMKVPEMGQGQEQERRPPVDPELIISKDQLAKLRAIGKMKGWTPEQGHDLLTSYRYNRLEEITERDYEAICNRLKQGPPK